MPIINCFRYLDQNIMPFADFLHSPTSFPITKQATKSYFGIILSFSMIVILIYLSIVEIEKFNKYDTITYSQDFFEKSKFGEKNITLGFQVPEDWANDVKLIVTAQEKIELKKCDKNLMESENGAYQCIVNYTLKIDQNSDSALKLS